MSGPEYNPRGDEAIDREEYEKWEEQQKGETMPKGERLEMAQEYGKDHPWPTFDDWHKEHHEFGKIAWPCRQPMRCFWRWTRKTDLKLNQYGIVIDQPIASAERPSFEQWWMEEGIYLLPSVGEPPEHAAIAEAAWNAALQSVPSSPLILVEGQSDVVQSGAPSPPPEVSHYKYRAGRGYLKPVMQPGGAGQPDEYERGRLQGLYEAADALRGAQRYNKKEWNDWVCTIANEIDGLRTKPSGFDYLANEVNAALEKLRELVARWRSPDWARAYMSDDRMSEFICADELHAILAELAPHPAEKD